MGDRDRTVARRQLRGIDRISVSRRDFVVFGALAGPLAALAQAETDPRVLEVFAAINEIRRQNRLGVLEWDDRVAGAARGHAENMARRNFFSHSDPMLGDLADRLDRASIDWHHCAENIFEEQGYSDPAAVAVESWMKSPGHRTNILSPNVTRTGVGLAIRSDGSHWLDQIFIRPRTRS